MDVESNIVMSNLRKYLAMTFFLQDARDPRHRAAASSGVLNIRTPSPTQEVRLLSGGNQQKIVIAKWLMRDCDILFFDEPTRGIDVGAKNEIYKLLRSLADQGKAIVMISSELPEVLRMSDRILVMCEGRITGELSAAAGDAGTHHASGDAARNHEGGVIRWTIRDWRRTTASRRPMTDRSLLSSDGCSAPERAAEAARLRQPGRCC